MTAQSTPRAGVGRPPSPLAASLLIAFLLSAFAAGADSRLWAQDDDPADVFINLVLEEGYDADEARDAVASRYGMTVATEVAAFWCSPEPADGCEGSDVLDAWLVFEDLILGGSSADAAAAELAQYDEALATAIAVYWCSPEPGDGCSGTHMLDAWLQFDDLMTQGHPAADVLAALAGSYGQALADGIAAFTCGDLTCAEDEPGHAMAEEPAPQPVESGERPGKKNKYPKKRQGGRPGG